jgi:uncharacterized protein YggT (Ycf19 family)
MSVVPGTPDNPHVENRPKELETRYEPPTAQVELASAERSARRRRRLAKWSQAITLIFIILELAIAFRVLLELIGANPASPFAQFMYQMTGPFLGPFTGLTVTPAAGGSVLEIPALIAMAAYGVLYLLILRAMWLIFEPAKARDAAKYEPDL